MIFVYKLNLLSINRIDEYETCDTAKIVNLKEINIKVCTGLYEYIFEVSGVKISILETA